MNKQAYLMVIILYGSNIDLMYYSFTLRYGKICERIRGSR